MSALVNKQAEFLYCIARLILAVQARDWGGDRVQFTSGDFNVERRVGHMRGSLHYSRLAADLNLFVNGVYITGHHPHWDAIGEIWEAMHPDNRWGGKFASRDYNHFSRAHNGKA